MKIRVLTVLAVAVASAALAQVPIQPFAEGNSLRILLGPFRSEDGLPVSPESVQLSLDTIPSAYGERAVNLWAMPENTATPSASVTGTQSTETPTRTGTPQTATPSGSPTLTPTVPITLDLVVPFDAFRVVKRTPGVKSQRARLTYRWRWHATDGSARQGKGWTDLSIERNDVLDR